MAVPGTRTWSAGEKITASRMNTEVRDALDFLLDPPRAHVYNSAGQVFANGTTVLCDWPDEAYDSQALHSGANSTRVTLVESGLWVCHLAIGFPDATYTTLTVNPRLNAGGVSTDGTSLRTEDFAPRDSGIVKWPFEFRASAGDHLEVFVTQTSGASRTSSAFSLAHGVQVRWVAI